MERDQGCAPGSDPVPLPLYIRAADRARCFFSSTPSTVPGSRLNGTLALGILLFSTAAGIGRRGRQRPAAVPCQSPRVPWECPFSRC